MEEVTGFLDGTPIKDETYETLSRTTFYHLFITNILPSIVIAYNVSEFKVVITVFFKILCIT